MTFFIPFRVQNNIDFEPPRRGQITIAGIPKLVHNRCGWLIPSGSVDALVGAMKSALQSSPQDLSKIGVVGRRRILAHHDSQRNGAHLFKLIHSYSGNLS